METSTKKWIATFGGIGLLPAMPGTYASFAAAVIYYLLWLGLHDWTRLVAAALIVLAGGVTVALWPWTREHFKGPDPRQYVLDEAAGQWITLLFVPLGSHPAHPAALVAVGFFLFRGFDVTKPYPISAIERIHGGWGVLLDDVAAGVYAGIGFWVLQLLSQLLLGPEFFAAAT